MRKRWALWEYGKALKLMFMCLSVCTNQVFQWSFKLLYVPIACSSVYSMPFLLMFFAAIEVLSYFKVTLHHFWDI